MKSDQITNSNLRQLDWAQDDRAKALHAMQTAAPRTPCAGQTSGWGVDVAGSDPRSVRASLAGKGDARATWWKVFSWAFCNVVPGADLERAMYTFHSLHHQLTIARLEFLAAVVDTASDIERDGIIAAARRSLAKQFSG